jgi:hypothetical protein
MEQCLSGDPKLEIRIYGMVVGDRPFIQAA